MKPAHLMMAFLLSCAIFAQEPVDHVNPIIGTGKFGNCYPGAQAPSGMISWSPDNAFENCADVEARTGYKHYRDEIYGFTVTQICGVGCFAAQGLPVKPVTGKLDTSPVFNNNASPSKYAHKHEHASPGYYNVFRESYEANIALTVSTRWALLRDVFPQAQKDRSP